MPCCVMGVRIKHLKHLQGRVRGPTDFRERVIISVSEASAFSHLTLGGLGEWCGRHGWGGS